MTMGAEKKAYTGSCEAWPQDIARVRDHMMRNHCGWRCAARRQDIAQALVMEDRHLRNVCAEIPEIISSHELGYYILPLMDMDGEETRKALEIINGEDRRRMISLYLRQRRRRKAIKEMRDKGSGFVPDLFGGGNQ